MLRWLGRYAVMRKRLADSWMGLWKPAQQNDPTFFRLVLMPMAARVAAATGATIVDLNLLQQADIDNALQGHNNQLRQEHQNRFPINDNLFALITTCLADLNEVMRERMSSTLAMRGISIEAYTFDIIREVFLELFCNPKSLR